MATLRARIAGGGDGGRSPASAPRGAGLGASWLTVSTAHVGDTPGKASPLSSVGVSGLAAGGGAEGRHLVDMLQSDWLGESVGAGPL